MKNLQVTSLHFAVRARVLLKYWGQLLLVFAALTAVTLLFSLLAGELRLALIYGAVVTACGLAGFLLQRLDAPGNLQNNEALVLTAGIFIFASLVASIPFHLSGIPLADALFEAISAITTTGLSTLPTVENMPQTFLFSRAWLQWTGGLGIVVLSVAILLPQSQAALRLFSGNWQKDDLITSAQKYALAVLKVYILLTLVGIGALLLTGIDWLDAIAHILAAVSTGGFSTHDSSLAGLDNWPARAVVTFFSFLGAISLGLFYQAFQKGPRSVSANPEVLGLAGMTLAATVLLSVFLFTLDGFSLLQAIRHGPLMAFSAQTTTGFSSTSVAELSGGSKLLVIILMGIGGNIGSTAGGIKIMRLLIIFKMIRHLILKIGLAAGTVVHPRYGGKRLETEEIERCFLLAFLFIGVVIISWLPFVILGHPPIDSLFEVVSATGTVGLSTGITSAELAPLLKGILGVDMIMGRLEIIAFLILFFPYTWIGKRKKSFPKAGKSE